VAGVGRGAFGPVIDEVVAASGGFEARELDAVRRYLTSVLERARRTRES